MSMLKRHGKESIEILIRLRGRLEAQLPSLLINANLKKKKKKKKKKDNNDGLILSGKVRIDS